MGAIRLFLAFGVFYAHIGQGLLSQVGLPPDYRLVFGVRGGYSVYYFYVVSGFLISYVLDLKYTADPNGAYQFYKARFLRIFPLWWAVYAFAVLVATSNLWTWFKLRSLSELFSGILLYGVDWLVPFSKYPSYNFQLFPSGVEVGWTLGAELTFYLFAPLVLRSLRLACGVFFGSVIIRLAVYQFVGPNSPTYAQWAYFFFPGTACFFVAGHLTRVLYKKLAVDYRFGLILLAASPMFSINVMRQPIDNSFFYLGISCFALSLPAVFEYTKDNRLMNFLGDLTYPLYLTNALVVAALISTWSGVGTWGGVLISAAKSVSFGPYIQSLLLTGILASLALVVATLTHFLIERPIASVVRRLFIFVEDVTSQRGLILSKDAPIRRLTKATS